MASVTVRNYRGLSSLWPVIFDSYRGRVASLRFPTFQGKSEGNLAEGGFVNTHKWVGNLIRFALFALAAFVLAVNCANTARAQGQPQESPEVQQLKDRLKQLELTVDELKAELLKIENSRKDPQAPAGEKAAAVVAAAPSAADVNAPPVKADQPQGESTFSIYGFAMLNSGYEFQASDPKWFDTVRPVKLPAFRGQFEPGGNTYFSVRQYRFGAKSTTPTK